MKNTTLLQEQKRSTILFLSLFYIVFFVYDIFYYDLFPAVAFLDIGSADPTWYELNYLKYLIMIGLIPFCFFWIRKEKMALVKYVVFFVYVATNLVTDIFFFKDSPSTFSSGNLVEVVIILFSPIFVNKKFFYVVTFGLIIKYLLVGLFLQSLVVILFPIIIIVVLSFIAFLLLHRFLNYLKALEFSYNEQLEGMVRGIIATLELKDPYTRGHSERVAAYASSMARATGKYTESELNQFYYACLLHDIGKVSIPDSILTKAGKLTGEEYEIVKSHPVVGAKAVEGVKGIEDNIDVIYHHHERWDGKGYPDGLAGENISLLARITAVADAFDAMTSSRSYRPALPYKEAYKRILEGKGSQFDPKLVDLFIGIFPKWVEISKNYRKGMDMRGGEFQHENPQTEQN